MQGLIFVTWEKYLIQRFGTAFLETYRSANDADVISYPLASRVYADEILLAGVTTASRLTRLPIDTLLREYGRYFILNGLTSHLCAYLLEQVQSGQALLLAMREAHAQMRRTPDKLIPPVFGFEVSTMRPQQLTLVYDSPRHLCAVLWGAIEGAAERYGEKVQIVERACMKHGAPQCRLELLFIPRRAPIQETPEQLALRQRQQRVANGVLAVLPDYDGMTLLQLQNLLRQRHVASNLARPSLLLDALNHLQHAGLVSSSANQPGDELSKRRYWRASTLGAGS